MVISTSYLILRMSTFGAETAWPCLPSSGHCILEPAGRYIYLPFRSTSSSLSHRVRLPQPCGDCQAGLRTGPLPLRAHGPTMAPVMVGPEPRVPRPPPPHPVFFSFADNFRRELRTSYPWRTCEIRFILVLRRYFRVALLPSSADVSCLFRTKVHPATESILFNDMFRVAISQTALQQKTLRVDLCPVSKHRSEECLVGRLVVPAPHSGSDRMSRQQTSV